MVEAAVVRAARIEGVFRRRLLVQVLYGGARLHGRDGVQQRDVEDACRHAHCQAHPPQCGCNVLLIRPRVRVRVGQRHRVDGVMARAALPARSADGEHAAQLLHQLRFQRFQQPQLPLQAVRLPLDVDKHHLQLPAHRHGAFQCVPQCAGAGELLPVQLRVRRRQFHKARALIKHMALQPPHGHAQAVDAVHARHCGRAAHQRLPQPLLPPVALRFKLALSHARINHSANHVQPAARDRCVLGTRGREHVQGQRRVQLVGRVALHVVPILQLQQQRVGGQLVQGGEGEGGRRECCGRGGDSAGGQVGYKPQSRHVHGPAQQDDGCVGCGRRGGRGGHGGVPVAGQGGCQRSLFRQGVVVVHTW
mmetsp:Transcript_13864/g.35386  ORF Transcript_13864/g.35386 Transcript_13864/m.35386 type:complete len:363 (+) Transcript_13864:306-1394(+)